MQGLYLDTRIANHPVWRVCEEQELMQIPPELLKCVCFTERLAGSERKLNGTAFLVAEPLEGVSSAVQTEPIFVYAVTAAHNLRDGDGDDAEWDGLRLILNTKSGTDFIEAPPKAWMQHPCSDTAILPIGEMPSHFDCLYYPADSYVDVDFFKTFQLGPGEEVLVTGLLWAHPGSPQITPIVRVGHVAGFPVDEIAMDTGAEGGVLIEILSFGGLSGSPAFIHLSDWRRDDFGRGDLLKLEGERGLTGGNHLLGIVQGRFETQEPRTRTTEPLNVGITAVIPAARIAELRQAPILEQRRSEMAKKLNERAPKTRRSSVPETPKEDSEFERFEHLARHVVKMPKPSRGKDKS